MKRLHAVASAVLLTVVPLFAACGGGGATGGSGGQTSTGSHMGGSSSSGGVQCMANEENCGGVCADLTSDPSHCGACGTACGTGSLCCASACVETAACSFAVTSIKPATGWQNGGDWITVTGQGFTAGMKVFIGDGRAAVKVLDAKTARIKTPPGPLGASDVKVQLGSSTAVLHGAFQYSSAGLTTPWEQKKMPTVRGEDPGVAVMQDARVLITGGTTKPDSTADALSTALVYTRMTDTVTDVTSPMSTTRWQHSAVTLLDGRVLVVGGACYNDLSNCNGSDPTAADLFDPQSNMFTPTKSKLNIGRAYTRSVLLPDGRVLIASANDGSLEVYDPDQDAFTLVQNPVSAAPHLFGFMVLLRDGRAMVGGGDGGNTRVELFDPDTNMITATGALNQGRSMLTAHTLPDGRVLVIGGASQSAGGITDPLDSMEAWDPKTGTWTTLPYKLSIGRCWHASALVRDGSVLVMGGYTAHGDCNSLIDTVDQVDPVAGTVMPFATLPNKNTEWVAVTLLDGSVLGVGGGECGAAEALPDIDFLPGAKGPN
jgi:hypothetical protein